MNAKAKIFSNSNKSLKHISVIKQILFLKQDNKTKDIMIKLHLERTKSYQSDIYITYL